MVEWHLPFPRDITVNVRVGDAAGLASKVFQILGEVDG